MGEKFGCTGVVDFDEILNNQDVQAVIIASEPQRHIMAVQAAEAGKHLLIEKPLAPTLEEGHKILEVSRQHDITASVVSQRRFGKSNEHIQEILRSKTIGKIHFIDASVFIHRDDGYYLNGNQWRLSPSGGIVLNRFIHTIDILVFLFGSVTSVFARLIRTNNELPVDNEAIVVLEFKNNISATIHGSSAFAKTYGESITIVGEAGSIRKQGTN